MIKSILTVCVGNICRSPMAEGLLRHHLRHRMVTSAGIAALDGNPPAPYAADLLAARGIDIAAHRARTLAEWLCESADLILVMDLEQKRIVEQQYPFTRGRLFRLGQFSGFDVFDPYRAGKDTFQECLKLIERGVDDWVRRIESID